MVLSVVGLQGLMLDDVTLAFFASYSFGFLFLRLVGLPRELFLLFLVVYSFVPSSHSSLIQNDTGLCVFDFSKGKD